MLARRFLYIIAILIALVLAAGLAWSLFQQRLMRLAFVPAGTFIALPDATAPDYAGPGAWLARPDLTDDPSRWLPPGVADPVGKPRVAVFYIPPTTYLRKDRWNAPTDDAEANYRLNLFARSQASAFNGLGAIWAPRYRQATFGAFLAASDPRSQRAIAFAYADVSRAFDAFLAANPTGPILLAGHSQGSLHLLRLLQEKVAGTPIAARIIAAYAIGWPISIEADVPALGLPACAAADQAHCLVAWQSFAEPADPWLLTEYFDASTGYARRPRKSTHMLCVNPLTGTLGGAAEAGANLGALVPDASLASASLTAGLVGARCSPEGLLLIGAAPAGYGAYVLPGNNFHVFDYALFWANLRADAARRLAAFGK